MTGIEWTDETWNPVIGCSVVSPGCTNCYAMRMAARLEAISVAHEAKYGGDPGPTLYLYRGLTEETRAGAVWTGRTAFVEAALEEPFHWRKPRRVFVCSMGDLFHESVSFETIDRIWAVMALCPHLTFQVLTKRPERARDYLVPRSTLIRIDQALVPLAGLHHPDPDALNIAPPQWPLPNVWIGTSIEDAPRLARLEVLRATPAAVRFISAEPLLGPLEGLDLTGIDWVIAGGESGPRARPSHPDWFRSIRDQCQAVDVPFFFKQWGEWGKSAPAGSVTLPVPMNRHGWLGNDGTLLEPTDKNYRLMHKDDLAAHPRNFTLMLRVGKKLAGRTLDGRTWSEFPSTP